LRNIFFAVITISILCLITSNASPSSLIGSHAVLKALDKVTARVSKITIKIGETANFGALTINLSACYFTLPEDPPESAAHLTIEEENPSEKSNYVFKGWMFSSSPALNPLEHPVYDVWVLRCINTDEKLIDSGSAPQTGG